MANSEEFMGLILDDHALRTPAGEMHLDRIIRAEFVRETEVTGRKPSESETSMPAVAGGAVVGGALLGGVGAVVGAVAGSTVNDETPGRAHVETLSTAVVFATPEAEYSLPVPKEQEMGAIAFVGKVEKAARKKRKR